MSPFVALTAVAAPLDVPDLATDTLFPSRFLDRPLGPDYARYLFHDLRFTADGARRADFILNRPGFESARILVAASNFGCGSAREGAVYALVAYGVRAVVAPSFGGIFEGNCLANGIVPVRLADDVTTRLRGQLRDRPGAEMTVDLARQVVVGPDGTAHPFVLDAFWKRRLIQGLDGVAATLEHAAQIDAFEDIYRRELDWLFIGPEASAPRP